MRGSDDLVWHIIPGSSMVKKYIVRLTTEECALARSVIQRLSGGSQKVRRAQILLQADMEQGPGWTDQLIAAAYHCRSQTVAYVRQRLVERGFTRCLEGDQRSRPTRARLLDGRQEAQVIATRLGAPPAGYANWSLRLLSRKVVELGIVDAVSHETLRQTLKKMP